jgi:hypothetical protein
MQQVMANLAWAIQQGRLPIGSVQAKPGDGRPTASPEQETGWDYAFEPVVMADAASSMAQPLRAPSAPKHPWPAAGGAVADEPTCVANPWGDQPARPAQTRSTPALGPAPDAALRQRVSELLL